MADEYLEGIMARVEPDPDDWEKRIRAKVHAAGILTAGEWTYLVGVFAAAREYDEEQKLRRRT